MTREIALTTNRHEIVSPITGKEVTESFFGKEVEDPNDVENHLNTVLIHLMDSVPLNATLIVYVTGASALFQAVFAAWIERNCSGPMMSLDMYPGELVFAHWDKNAETYVFKHGLTGKTIPLGKLSAEKPKSS